METLPPDATIKTVRSRIEGDGTTLGKFELHLIETKDGKRTLVIDKVFTDIDGGKGSGQFDPKLSNGMLGAMQAIRSLFGNGETPKLDDVKIWSVVNLETLLAIHEAERAGGATAATRHSAIDRSLITRFAEKIIGNLGLQKTASSEISGGINTPLVDLIHDVPPPPTDTPFARASDQVEPIRYHYARDGRARMLRSRQMVSDYRRRLGIELSTPNVSPVFERFDVRIPVAPIPK